MASRPTFPYPVPHSTFIPINYTPSLPLRSAAESKKRKRKRTESSATLPGEPIDGEQNHEEDEEAASDEDIASQLPASLRSALHLGDRRGDDSDTTAGLNPEDLDDWFSSDQKRLASNREDRIRNAGYADDIVEALPPPQPTSLAAKHLSNVNTILHLSLLNGDWQRAKRAFKLLMLSDPEEDPKNIRLKKIWKLGIEILRHEERKDVSKSRDDSDGMDQVSDGDERTAKRDYAKVIQYLNRLVVMFPYHKNTPLGKGVNATVILPILVHYEILALQEKMDDATKEHQPRVAEQVIEGIDAVTDRLKGLQGTPPWVDMAELWKLRGMMHVWASDLSDMHTKDNLIKTKHLRLAAKIADQMKAKNMDGWQDLLIKTDDDGAADVGAYEDSDA